MRKASGAAPRKETSALTGAAVQQTEPNGNFNDINSFPSPLQRFVDAKGQVRDIYGRIERCIKTIRRILEENPMSAKFSDLALMNDIESYVEGVGQIGGMLARDHMKVVFFGRTSNGKSTVINAMLHSKVLPFGMGHTTRCFLQVEGTSGSEKYMLKENSDESISLDSIDKMANAFCSQEMGEDVLFRILWPKSDSRLLQNEVVLVDSPGVDITPQFDEWIDKHCLDADVFVLVSNAEATLTNSEMNFFRRVKAKLSKPNIFILNNRWDASVVEPETIDQVRSQHTKRCLDFLVDELQVCDRLEAGRRIYFVSAREALHKRLQRKGIYCPISVANTDGAESRLKEFEQFEHQFELCISKSAIVTKFNSHIEKGQLICDHVYEALNALQKSIKLRKEHCLRLCSQKEAQLSESKTKAGYFVGIARKVAVSVASQVKEHIAYEFRQQLNRIESFVESYSEKFVSEALLLSDYKTKLIAHVDHLVNGELPERCSMRVIRQISQSEQNLARDVANLLPSERSKQAEALVLNRQPFEFTFVFPCKDYLADFREDLQFRFSLGFTKVMALLTSEKFLNVLTYKNVRCENDESVADSDRILFTGGQAISSGLVKTASAIADGGVGLLICCTLIKRVVGWPVLIAVVVLYQLLYVYERLSWNDQAREVAFKQQFCQHLEQKMKMMEGTLVETCRHQVVREINDVTSRLLQLTDEAFENIRNEVEELKREARLLDEFFAVITPVKNNLAMLRGDLDNFKNNYLRPHL